MEVMPLEYPHAEVDGTLPLPVVRPVNVVE